MRNVPTLATFGVIPGHVGKGRNENWFLGKTCITGQLWKRVTVNKTEPTPISHSNQASDHTLIRSTTSVNYGYVTIILTW